MVNVGDVDAVTWRFSRPIWRYASPLTFQTFTSAARALSPTRARPHRPFLRHAKVFAENPDADGRLDSTEHSSARNAIGCVSTDAGQFCERFSPVLAISSSRVFAVSIRKAAATLMSSTYVESIPVDSSQCRRGRFETVSMTSGNRLKILDARFRIKQLLEQYLAARARFNTSAPSSGGGRICRFRMPRSERECA